MVLLATFALVFALPKRAATQQKEEAQRRRAQVLREGARGALEMGNVLESRAKLRGALEIEDAVEARALWWNLRSNPTLWNHRFGSLPYAAAFSPNGRTVAVSCQDHGVYLLDTTTRQGQG